jgi:hypothetical protein
MTNGKQVAKLFVPPVAGLEESICASTSFFLAALKVKKRAARGKEG